QPWVAAGMETAMRGRRDGCAASASAPADPADPAPVNPARTANAATDPAATRAVRPLNIAISFLPPGRHVHHQGTKSTQGPGAGFVATQSTLQALCLLVESAHSRPPRWTSTAAMMMSPLASPW